MSLSNKMVAASLLPVRISQESFLWLTLGNTWERESWEMCFSLAELTDDKVITMTDQRILGNLVICAANLKSSSSTV